MAAFDCGKFPRSKNKIGGRKVRVSRLATLLVMALVVAAACAAPSVSSLPDTSGAGDVRLAPSQPPDAANGGPDRNPVLSFLDPNTGQPVDSTIVQATSHQASDAKGFCPAGEDIDIHVRFEALDSFGNPYRYSALELGWGWYWDRPGAIEHGLEQVTGSTRGTLFPEPNFPWPVSVPCAQTRPYRLEVSTYDPGHIYQASWNVLVTTDPRYPTPLGFKGYRVAKRYGSVATQTGTFAYDVVIEPAA